MTITAPTELIVAFVLATVRASAWIILVPPLGTRAIPAPVKIGLAAALALAVTPSLAEAPLSLEVPSLIAAVALQVGVGLALGFVTLLALAAVQAAGDLIDLFAGFTIAQALDPLTGASSSVFGRFYQLLATTLLFAMDGHVLLVRGFLRSYEAVALRPPSFGRLSETMLGGLGDLMLAAVEIAAPLLAALFLAEVGMALLARAAPQMNVFILGFPVKILLTLGLVGLALPILPGAVSSLVERSVRTGNGVVQLFEP